MAFFFFYKILKVKHVLQKKKSLPYLSNKFYLLYTSHMNTLSACHIKFLFAENFNLYCSESLIQSHIISVRSPTELENAELSGVQVADLR